MQLYPYEPNDLSDEAIAEELATALLTLECGYQAVSTGDYAPATIKDCKEKTQSILTRPSQYPLFGDFIAWRDYGFYGKYRSDISSPHDAYALLLMSAPAVELFGSSHAFNCTAILQAIVVREKLDHALGRPNPGIQSEGRFTEFTVGGQHEGLTNYELALLSGMSVQAVRNEFQKPNAPSMERNESGFVTLPCDVAHKWLLDRRGYRDTYSSEVTNDSILVPQARDGSFFSRACKQGSGYKVGKKGEEQYMENFMDALDLLSKMPKAYWRRPSPASGVPGIVSSVTWVKKTRKELGLN